MINVFKKVSYDKFSQNKSLNIAINELIKQIII